MFGMFRRLLEQPQYGFLDRLLLLGGRLFLGLFGEFVAGSLGGAADLFGELPVGLPCLAFLALLLLGGAGNALRGS